jgi:hypothetical protein
MPSLDSIDVKAHHLLSQIKRAESTPVEAASESDR